MFSGIFTVVVLSGCSQQSMSDQLAGENYLAAVCPANQATGELDPLLSELRGENAQDLARVIKAAAATRDSIQAAAAALDSESLVWPVDVNSDVQIVRDGLFSQAAALQSLSASDSVAQAKQFRWPIDEIGEASQRLRSRLGLSSDTNEGCDAWLLSDG